MAKMTKAQARRLLEQAHAKMIKIMTHRRDLVSVKDLAEFEKMSQRIYNRLSK